jgi:RNA-directed DNA polymerase
MTPEEQKNSFLALKTPRDLADLLGIEYSLLIYHIYKVPDSQKYKIFEIPKKSGGVRKICAPVSSLKIIQHKINEILLNIYTVKPSVYGYVKNKNIVNNANKHSRKRYVFNLDLKDFFPSINFGRVRGLFIGIPYNLPKEVATVLAQICCFHNELPQGTPTSPIVSNMICAQMDSQLQKLAMENKCFYTRYADDLTFSTSLKEFPPSIAIIRSFNDVEIGKELEEIILNNGFNINKNKIRMQQRFRREQVTGLTVNEFPNVRRNYIRQVRAMLHAWEKFGLTNAEIEYLTRYNRKYRNPQLPLPGFKQIVKGKIEFLGMVRGRKNKIFTQFLFKYNGLNRRDKGIPSLRSLNLEGIYQPHLYTEGITDVNILITAWNVLYQDESCPFVIMDSNPTRKSDPGRGGGGAQQLKTFLNGVREDYPHIVIGMFDRDTEGNREYSDLRSDYIEDNETNCKMSKARKSGAFLLPIPQDKEEYAKFGNLCIEYYFSEESLNMKTKEGFGLIFEFPPSKHVIGNTVLEEENRILETRKIKDGKVVFSESIIQTFPAAEFESFRILFEKIFFMIEQLENTTQQ